MRGSLIITFEASDFKGGDYYQVSVNNQVRYIHYNSSNNLYNTYLYEGDVVTIISNSNCDFDVIRTDYTTDDQGGDRGIRDIQVSNSINTTGVTFTATTVPEDYNFEYKVDVSVPSIVCFNIGTGFDGIQTPTSVAEVKLYNNKIYCGGNFLTYSGVTSVNMIILNTDGTINTTIPAGRFSSSVQGVRSIEFQSDGKILVGGGFTTYSGQTAGRICRLNSDLTLDTSFTTGLGFNNNVFDIEIQSDGKILVGGNFTSFSGTTIYGLARLNSDGSLDTSFSGGTVSTNIEVYDINLFNDGKILISGEFQNWGGNASYDYIAKLNSNGTIDTSFSFPISSVTGNTGVWKTEILNDGNILLAGYFEVSGIKYGLVKVNASGTTDGSFTQIQDEIIDIVVLSSGKILYLVGASSLNKGLYRANSNGTSDGTFNNVTLTSLSSIYTQESILVKPNNMIVVGGSFTQVNSISYNRIFECYPNGTLNMC
jgi:uncharacterized delta-60 repeat protein